MKKTKTLRVAKCAFTTVLPFVFIALLGRFQVQAQGNYFNYWDSTFEVRELELGGITGGIYYVTNYFDGDTLMNGKYYYKLMKASFMDNGGTKQFISYRRVGYKRESPSGYFIRYYTALREDTIFNNNKVKTGAIGDCVFDPANPFQCCTATYNDTIQLGNRKLKRLGVSPRFYPQYLLEGVGSTDFFCTFGSDIPYSHYAYVTKQNQTAILSNTPAYNFFLPPIRTANFTNTTLPLELLTFSGQQLAETVTLHWQTNNETNTQHFMVEASTEGFNFLPLGTVMAKEKGNGIYSFTAKTNQAYFRLKMTDKDGRFVYSQVLKLEKSAQHFSLVPNPAKGTTTLGLHVKEAQTIFLQMVNAKGQICKTQKEKLLNGYNSVVIDLIGLVRGIYCVQIQGIGNRMLVVE